MSQVDEKISGAVWKAKLLEIDASITRRNIPDKHSNARYYGNNEVGFIHQVNKSCIRIADDGDINMFVSDVSGIKIDKQSESVTEIADTVNVIAKKFNLVTSPNGFSWNGYYINPTLYTMLGRGLSHEDKDIKLTVTYKTWACINEKKKEYGYVDAYKSIPLFVKKPVKTTYNQGVNDLLRDLNIPL
jgi:hypothetical protein